MTHTLNSQQKAALDLVLKGKSVFLTGPGGVGKSFLVHSITKELEQRGRRVAVTALTGCAALLLGNGAKTIHSWAGIGLGRDPSSKIIAGITKYNFPARKRWMCTDVLIIDEVSMLTPELLEKLNDVAMAIRRKANTFGGLQVIFTGDFYQLPPVYTNEERPSNEFAFESPIWKDLGLETIVLTEIMRQRDPVFHKVLDEARNGSLSDESLQILATCKDKEWQSLKVRPTLLFSRRAEVDMINQQNIRALKGTPVTYSAHTVFDATLVKGLTEKSENVQKAIVKLDRSAPYKTELDLRIGAQVMLIHNLDPEKGLVNGSRGVIEGFTESVQKYPIVYFQSVGKTVVIEEATWECEDLEGVKRSQIPLILAYAVTIHKCQGATLDSALIDIGSNTFEVGQAYVALSRVKSLESLYVFDLDRDAFKAHKKVVEFYRALQSPVALQTS